MIQVYRYRVKNLEGLLDEQALAVNRNFAQDSRRRWYLNVVVEIPDAEPRAIERAVGIHARIKNARNDFLHKARIASCETSITSRSEM
jgi:hypothetical protein